jgi:hypothetical protein
MSTTSPSHHPFAILVCLVLICGFFSSAPVAYDNLLQFRIASSTPPTPTDTVYVGGEYQFEILIENSYRVFGMSMNLRFWWDSDIDFGWQSQPGGLGFDSFVTIIPGSRLDATPQPFDMTGLLVTQYDVNEFTPDTMLIGGVAFNNGLVEGPLDAMIAIHFHPRFTGQWENGVIGSICIDTATHVSPSNAIVYVNESGQAIGPDIAPGVCLPVKLLCGNPNGDAGINVADAVYMINFIFKDGSPPDPWQLGDTNADGILDVGDAVFLIAAIFRGGPMPACP